MSTQIEEGNEEGGKDPDDNLIDSLIDDIHFDDLVLEKNVADVDQIEVFCNYYSKHMDILKRCRSPAIEHAKEITQQDMSDSLDRGKKDKKKRKKNPLIYSIWDLRNSVN